MSSTKREMLQEYGLKNTIFIGFGLCGFCWQHLVLITHSLHQGAVCQCERRRACAIRCEGCLDSCTDLWKLWPSSIFTYPGSILLWREGEKRSMTIITEKVVYLICCPTRSVWVCVPRLWGTADALRNSASLVFPPQALKEAPEALQSERRPTRVHIPGYAYGLTNVPKGKLTIAEAVKALGSHQHQPQTWTPEKIAQEYFLDFKDTKAALEFFVPFKVEIIPPKTRTANQIKAS